MDNPGLPWNGLFSLFCNGERQIETNVTESICEGSNYTLGNQTLSVTGSYMETFTTSKNCDSTVLLTLIVQQPSTSQEQAVICPGQTYIFDNQALNQAGTYSATFQNTAGCDSVVTLSLEINEVINNTCLLYTSPSPRGPY